MHIPNPELSLQFQQMFLLLYQYFIKSCQQSHIWNIKIFATEKLNIFKHETIVRIPVSVCFFAALTEQFKTLTTICFRSCLSISDKSRSWCDWHVAYAATCLTYWYVIDKCGCNISCFVLVFLHLIIATTICVTDFPFWGIVTVYWLFGSGSDAKGVVLYFSPIFGNPRLICKDCL